MWIIISFWVVNWCPALNSQIDTHKLLYGIYEIKKMFNKTIKYNKTKIKAFTKQNFFWISWRLSINWFFSLLTAFDVCFYVLQFTVCSCCVYALDVTTFVRSFEIQLMFLLATNTCTIRFGRNQTCHFRIVKLATLHAVFSNWGFQTVVVEKSEYFRSKWKLSFA